MSSRRVTYMAVNHGKDKIAHLGYCLIPACLAIDKAGMVAEVDMESLSSVATCPKKWKIPECAVHILRK